MHYIFRGFCDLPPNGPQKNNIYFNNKKQKMFRFDGDNWLEFKPDPKIIHTIQQDDPYKAYERAMGIL